MREAVQGSHDSGGARLGFRVGVGRLLPCGLPLVGLVGPYASRRYISAHELICAGRNHANVSGGLHRDNRT